MKINALWKIASDMAAKKYRTYIGTVILCGISLALIIISGFSYILTQYGKIQCEKGFTKGIDNTGMFIVDTTSGDNWYQFEDDLLEEVRNQDYIYAIGNYSGYASGDEWCEELREIQLKSRKTEDGMLKYMVAYNGTFRLYNLSFEEGEYEYAELDDNHTNLYLGYDFKDIPIGTTYEFKDSNGKTRMTYTVKGIFEQGETIIDHEALYEESTMLETNYVLYTDSMVFCEESYSPINWYSYSIEDSTSIIEVEKNIQGIADKYGIKIIFGNCSAIISSRENENLLIIKTTLKMAIFISITTFIVLLCVQLADIMDNMKDYGILYGNGANTKDLMKILLFENIRKTLVAYVIVVILFMIILKCGGESFTIQYGINMNVVNNIMYGYTIWVALASAILMAIVSSIVPICIIRKLEPTKLIGGFGA